MIDEFHTAKEIREYYDSLRDKAIEELRKSCKHEQVSDWSDEWWALGHSTGFQLKVCNMCEKTIHRRTSCYKCEAEIIDDAIIKGDGSDNLPFGGHYCITCASKLRVTPST